jgi:hypothetical protein
MQRCCGRRIGEARVLLVQLGAVIIDAFDSLTRILGPVLLVFGLCLVTLVSITFFDVILPSLGVVLFSIQVIMRFIEEATSRVARGPQLLLK